MWVIAGAIDWTGVLVGAGISAVLALAIGALWTSGRGAVLSWYLLRRGEIRGVWYEILEPYEDKPRRVDKVKVRQRGQRIFGHIERLRPRGHGKWRFAGYVHGNVVVSVFFTTTPKKDPSSYGVINMYRDPSHEGRYCGYYTRPNFASFEAFVGSGLPRMPIVWQRQRPEV
jgi:hypothetical protein